MMIDKNDRVGRLGPRWRLREGTLLVQIEHLITSDKSGSPYPYSEFVLTMLGTPAVGDML